MAMSSRHRLVRRVAPSARPSSGQERRLRRMRSITARVLRVERRDDVENARRDLAAERAVEDRARGALRASPARGAPSPVRRDSARIAMTVSASTGASRARYRAPRAAGWAGRATRRGSSARDRGAWRRRRRGSRFHMYHAAYGGRGRGHLSFSPRIFERSLAMELRLREERRARHDDRAAGRLQAAHRLQAPRARASRCTRSSQVNSDEVAVFFKDGTVVGVMHPGPPHAAHGQPAVLEPHRERGHRWGRSSINEIYFVKTTPVRSVPFGGPDRHDARPAAHVPRHAPHLSAR